MTGITLESEAMVTRLYALRLRLADAAQKLGDLEQQRIEMKQGIYDTLRAGGKTQKDSEEAVRIAPEYVAKLQEVAGQEHARDLLGAEAEATKYRIQLTVGMLNAAGVAA